MAPSLCRASSAFLSCRLVGVFGGWGSGGVWLGSANFWAHCCRSADLVTVMASALARSRSTVAVVMVVGLMNTGWPWGSGGVGRAGGGPLAGGGGVPGAQGGGVPGFGAGGGVVAGRGGGGAV